jgi:hypothetical protein
VGDFNLSRYMSLGVSYVKSSLEINPVRGAIQLSLPSSVQVSSASSGAAAAHAA